MIEESLRQIVEACCERNDVREYHRGRVLEAVEKIWTERNLLSLLESGEMEIAGVDAEGMLQWKVTEFGKANARRLMGDK